MYSYRGYSASSKASQQRVTENGTMGRHTSSSPPPVLCDGKRRSIRDRLQGITSAMSWIKDELNDLKEADRALMDIFKQLQGDVGELNSYVSHTHRSSTSVSSMTTTLPAKEETKAVEQKKPLETNLELDFSVLDSALGNGDLDDDTFSESPSPVEDFRALTDSGTSFSNADTHVPRMVVHQISNNGHSGRDDIKVSDEDSPLESSPSGLSISLGSLDLDFSTPSFGLGTITEGRSLMNIPVTASSSGSSMGVGNQAKGKGGSLMNIPATAKSSGASMGASNPATRKQHLGIQRSISQQPVPPSDSGMQRSISQQPVPPSDSGMQRSISHQPLSSSDAASRARDFPRQSAPPKAAPSTQPKPRRGWFKKSSPPTSRKPSVTNKQRPVITVVRQGSVTSIGSQQPPPQDTLVDKKSSPSPPRSRRDASPTQPKDASLTQPKTSKVMAQVLPAQAQQELAARQLKQAGKVPLIPPGKVKPTMQENNGAAPQLQGGRIKQHSPISPRRSPQPPPKPLPAVPNSASKPPVPTARTSPPQRVSPTSVRSHGLLATPPEMRGSSSLNRLGPGKGVAEDTLSSISRNSSIDSGIQFASEGENGGGGGGGVGAHSESTAAVSSLAGVKESGSAASDGLGFGDFASDIFSALASKSWMQS